MYTRHQRIYTQLSSFISFFFPFLFYTSTSISSSDPLIFLIPAVFLSSSSDRLFMSIMISTCLLSCNPLSFFLCLFVSVSVSVSLSLCLCLSVCLSLSLSSSRYNLSLALFLSILLYVCFYILSLHTCISFFSCLHLSPSLVFSPSLPSLSLYLSASLSVNLFIYQNPSLLFRVPNNSYYQRI